ncbi:class I SAM-dependent methyltransferase [Paraliomyxa miuraensis]|uniref:class I SAM-dependent methyltransferase n=1 Tax=Paraliomyxa miuraensis TaxID=376150 RepID=UPI002251AABB|nr:class I SAM-dependent methyltransferase [Paraliomyxa miuraensis]MCX4248009.1 class I SAM-dependent methyltransferase [Paraliomyxa miuraensis]
MAKANDKDDTVAKTTSKKGASKKSSAGMTAKKKAAAKSKTAKPEPKAKKKVGKKPAAAAEPKPEPKAKKKAGKKAAVAAEPKPEPKAKKAGKKAAVAEAKPEPKAKKKAGKKAAVAAEAKPEPKKKAGKKPAAAAEPKAKKKAGKPKAEPKPSKKTANKKTANKKTANKKTANKKTANKKTARKAKAGKAAKSTLAERVDKHLLYQYSVQSPEADIEFFVDRYHELRGKDPVVLREDFCGTSLISTTWAALGDDRRAVGVDLDTATLEWARKHNLGKLDPEARARIDLRQANVLDGGGERSDVTCAMNFSYGVFKTRAELRRYLEVAFEQLADDGVFVTELYGGTEAIVQVTDEREVEDPTETIGDFTYVWEQASYNPITHETLCHIHFVLPDGSKLERAFTYDWRLWSIPELRELLYEVGFSSVRVYWEATDEDGDGTGEYYATEKEDNQESWLVYIIAAK